MTDRYQGFVQSSLGQLLVKNLGLPDPVPLKRYADGEPLVTGTVLTGGSGRLAESLPGLLDELDVTHAQTADPEARYRALVLDATGLTDSSRLGALRDFFGPLMRSLETCPRLVVIGTPPETVAGSERVAQRALEGFTRSLGKEVGRGGTAQLVYVAEGPGDTAGGLLSTLAFLLSPKSAYVSGQVVRIGTTADHARRRRGGRLAAPARGQGRPGHRREPGHRRADRPRAPPRRGHGHRRRRAAGRRLPGEADQRARGRLPRARHHRQGRAATYRPPGAELEHGGIDIVVHNAGITRDKKLANMAEDRWESVIGVNLTAPERITRELLDQKAIRANGRIIGVASIAGIAGNLGQTNYATSKAGVIGLVDSLKDDLADGITVNAVAPGFIETQMTAAVPFATREVGRRLNAMSQGGLPVDVAETIAWFASPGSTAVNGNVVRVCGQMMLGA